jgi:hypothetical protein
VYKKELRSLLFVVSVIELLYVIFSNTDDFNLVVWSIIKRSWILLEAIREHWFDEFWFEMALYCNELKFDEQVKQELILYLALHVSQVE